MPLIFKLLLLFLILPFVYALFTAWMPDDAVQKLVEAVIVVGVLAAIVGIPIFIVSTVIQALSPPRGRF